MVLSERTSIAIGVAIINNIESAIQMGGHTLKVVLFSIVVQPMILGVQFVEKMGMLNSKVRKSMWQICTVNEGVKEVLGENLIALNFNEGTNQEFLLTGQMFSHQCH